MAQTEHSSEVPPQSRPDHQTHKPTLELGRSARKDLLRHVHDDLTDDESRIEYLQRRNPMEVLQLLLAPSIFFIVTLTALVYFAVAWWIVVSVGAVGVLGLWLLLTYWRRSVICVTNRSIILKHDFPFIGDFHSMPLRMVASATSSRTVFGQLLGYKWVKIDGPGQMDQVFNWIPYVSAADEMVRAIRAYQGNQP